MPVDWNKVNKPPYPKLGTNMKKVNANGYACSSPRAKAWPCLFTHQLVSFLPLVGELQLCRWFGQKSTFLHCGHWRTWPEHRRPNPDPGVGVAADEKVKLWTSRRLSFGRCPILSLWIPPLCSFRYTLNVLEELGGGDKADGIIVNWVNKTLAEAGKSTKISSFKVSLCVWRV